MATVTLAPTARPAYAIAWAALPALIVTIPLARWAAVRPRIAFTAPRGLNDPVRWRFSALRKARAPMRSPSDRLVSSGVLVMCDATTAVSYTHFRAHETPEHL